MSSLILNLTSDASVRGMVAPDGSHRFSVYDFITMACQKADGGAYARKTYSNLVKEGSEFKDEIEKSVHNIHFPGGRGAATPTMTLRGLQRLLLILGTKVAIEFRALLEGTFTRVMAGDTSLIEVIRANSTSEAPIHQAYRQALEQEPVMLEDIGRKRKLDQENIEIEERRITCVERRIACVEKFVGMMDMLNPEWKNDAVLCRKLQDNLKTHVLNEDPAPTKQNQRIANLHPELMNKFMQAFTITDDHKEQTEENVLYDAFMATIPVKEREKYLELMFEESHNGDKLSGRDRKLFKGGVARVCKSSFRVCLTEFGGIREWRGPYYVWVNVRINKLE